MSGLTLLKGTVFDWSGTKFMIDRVQPNGDLVLERVGDGQLVVRPKSDVLADYVKGQVSLSTRALQTSTTRTAVYSRPLCELPLPMQAEIKRRVAYVRELHALGSFTFTSAFIKPLIEEVAQKIGDEKPPSPTTLWRWSRRFRETNDPRSVIPRIDLRGSKESTQSGEVLQLLTMAAEEAFKVSPLATVVGVHDRLLAKIEHVNRQRLHGEQLPQPSRRTTYRLLGRMQAYDSVVLREGKAVADKRFRLNKAGVTTNGILERVEVDHTPLDLFLIDEKTWLPLGRPTLTVLLDHYSRMVLGYYLSFGNPSAAAVMGALRHAILPKERATGVLPNLVTEGHWCSFGKPDVLVMDNGLEFHGLDVESVCFDLDIRLFYCPKHTPRFKGSIERFLKTINYFFAHQLPGTSFSRLHERGDYDPQKHALLTLAEFKQIFEKWVVDVYGRTVHRSLGVTPHSKWEDGLARREPSLPSSVYDLQKRIGLVEERSLRRDGVSLKGIRYSGPELQPILNMYGEGVKVRVVYDAEDLGYVQVWGPEDDDPVTVLAVNQSYASGLTYFQHELIREKQRAEGASTEDPTALLRGRQQLASAVEELMSSRKQKHRRKAGAIIGVSSSKPHASVKDIAESALSPVARPVLNPKLPPAIVPESVDPPVTRYARFQMKG